MSERLQIFSKKFRQENRIDERRSDFHAESAAGTLTPPPIHAVREKTPSGVRAILVADEPARPAGQEEPEISYPATESGTRPGSGLVPSVEQPQAPSPAQARAQAQAAAAARLGHGRWNGPEKTAAATEHLAARQTGSFTAMPAARQTGSFAAQPPVDVRATQSFKAVPAEASPSTSALRRAVGAAVSEKLPDGKRPSPDHVDLVDTGFDQEAFRLGGDARPRPVSELTVIPQSSAEEYVKEWLPRFRQEIRGDARAPLTWADLERVRQLVGVGNFPGLSAWYVRLGDQLYSGAEYLLGLHKPVAKGQAFSVLRGGPELYYFDAATGLLYTESQRRAAESSAKTGLFGVTTRLFGRR